MKYLLTLLMFVVTSEFAMAQIHTEAVDYTVDGKACEGYLAYKDNLTSNAPAILVFHEWWGLTPYIRHRVEQLADLGYVAFAADLYGKGVLATTVKDAQAHAVPFYTDRSLFRRGTEAALEILKKSPHVDTNNIAVIGYCFGGTAALELARDGAPVRGVVTFHGVLTTADPNDGSRIRAKVLVLTGGDDPNVPASQVTAFEDEMRKGHVDWEVVSYGNTVHAFTNPNAGSDPSKGMAYNEESDQRSWIAMKNFFDEIFH